MTSNVTLPQGTKNHGDPSILCLPPNWTDYFTFYAANYLVHIATIVSEPGQTMLETICHSTMAFFMPGYGALRAVNFLISNATISGKNNLQKAAKAGALCMLVAWKDLDHVCNNRLGRDDSWFTKNFLIEGYPEFVPHGRKVQGNCSFDERIYCLIKVPPHIPLKEYYPGPARSQEENSSETQHIPAEDIEVTPVSDGLKVAVSIYQVIWGIATLYEVRGNQITLYGYGAFGLTVVPYAWMSLVNLATNLLRPTYQVMYLIYTPDLDNVPYASGMVASIDRPWEPREDIPKLSLDRRHPWGARRIALLYIFGCLLAALVPLAVVGGFSGFRQGSELTYDQNWILSWYIVSPISSIAFYWLFVTTHPRFPREGDQKENDTGNPISLLIGFLSLGIPAVGGMVVVADMLKDFGICARL
ncbi:hypothetical protein F4820DRAFT_425071 [Hypoxylon rubiginosum]|uniref:Uncharacterized protein n=1 Tax=Hypoxylon rubiginosum TaxID=110542 RepID=A0ACB9YYL0_9PEZI|nr:hypothetical protein F4820DRAFT_425071 [Hypoxylon rubiginosum]